MVGKVAQQIKNHKKITYKIRRTNPEMEKFFLDSKSGDISFSFPMNSIKVTAHKITLASHSDVFRRMFFGNGGSEREREIKVVDATAADFKTFLRYFYCSTMEISNDNVAAMMSLADKYAVSNVFVLCDDFLKKTSTFHDILTAHRLANTFRRHDLKQFFEEKIQKQTKGFFASAQFKKCSNDELKTFLQLDHLNCDGKEVFYALMSWSKEICIQKGLFTLNMKHRRAQMGDCFYLIPFRSMDRKQISEIVKVYRGLFESDELIEIIGIMAENELTATDKFKHKLSSISSIHLARARRTTGFIINPFQQNMTTDFSNIFFGQN